MNPFGARFLPEAAVQQTKNALQRGKSCVPEKWRFPAAFLQISGSHVEAAHFGPADQHIGAPNRKSQAASALDCAAETTRACHNNSQKKAQVRLQPTSVHVATESHCQCLHDGDDDDDDDDDDDCAFLSRDDC